MFKKEEKKIVGKPKPIKLPKVEVKEEEVPKGKPVKVKKEEKEIGRKKKEFLSIADILEKLEE